MKNWYLDNPPPNIVSEYENDAISEYAQSNFTDVLYTSFSDNIILYNYNLTKSQSVKCIIQGNTADTYLKSMERTILFPIGTVKAGMYVFFENCYWIITGYPGNNRSYEKVTVKLCQYKVRWQKPDGTIVERWANLQSSSKYDDGLKDSNVMTLASDSIMLLLPNDDDGLTLDGKRIFISKKNPPDKVYLVSRLDGVLYDYGETHGGMFCFVTEKTELNEATDRPDLGLCDYISTELEDDDNFIVENSISGTISGNPVLKIGFNRKYTASLTDNNGDKIPWSNLFRWELDSLFDVPMVIDGDSVTLRVDDEGLTDEMFKLNLYYKNTILCEIAITIESPF